MVSLTSNLNILIFLALCAALGAFLSAAETSLWIVWSICVFLTVLCTIAIKPKFSVFRSLIILAVCVQPALFYLYSEARKPRPSASDLSRYVNREVIFEGRLSRPREVLHGLSILEPTKLLFPIRQNLDGLTLVHMPSSVETAKPAADAGPESKPLSDECYANGCDVLVKAKVRAPTAALHPWEFDQKKFWENRGVYSICFKPNKQDDQFVQVLDPVVARDGSGSLSNRFNELVTTARKRIVEMHRQNMSANLADLLSSMVLGNRAVTLDDTVTSRFRDVGLSHVLAASGFNLTIITVMAMSISRVLTRNLLLSNSFCFLSIAGFVALAGPSPSVVRAALMSSALLLGRCSRRSVNMLAILAASFLVTMLLDPLSVSDIGLQLSYVATVAIVCGANNVTDAFYSGKRKYLQGLAGSLATILVAQASVLPIQLFYFWQIGTMFLPANLLVAPLVTPITILGFSSSAVSLLICNTSADFILSCAAKLIDLCAWLPLYVMLLIVNALSSVESARLSLGPPPQPAICFYYVALFSSFLALHIKRCKLATFVVFMVALSLLIVRPKAEDVIVTTIQNSVAIVSQDGSAVTIPELKPNKTFQKFAAFHGAKPTQNFNLHSCRGQFVMQLGNFTFLIYRENIDKSCSSSNLQCEPLPFITGATTFMIVPGISHATSAECSKRLEKLRKILEQFRPYYVLLFSEGAYHRMPALFFSGYEPGSAPVGVSVVAPSGMRAIILRRI